MPYRPCPAFKFLKRKTNSAEFPTANAVIAVSQIPNRYIYPNSETA